MLAALNGTWLSRFSNNARIPALKSLVRSAPKHISIERQAHSPARGRGEKDCGTVASDADFRYVVRLFANFPISGSQIAAGAE
jgi:hypothetical protein